MTRTAVERPRPIGRVVNAATTGGWILATLVLLADWILDPTTVLPVDEATAGRVRSVAMLVAFVGGALVAGRRTQGNVEQETTPLSSPHILHPDTGALVPLKPVVELESLVKLPERPPPAMPQPPQPPQPPQSLFGRDEPPYPHGER